jgi:hypothetical protein
MHVGQAYLALADYVECEADIKRALAEDPRNVGVRLLQKDYKQKVRTGNPAAMKMQLLLATASWHRRKMTH